MAASVLVVEDEAIIAEDIQATLIGLGYEVPATASSGLEALALARSSRPDLVLMDIRIRGSMDGIETAALMREQHNVPVVYLTSHSDDATLARARLTEAHGYLLKPFDERDLRATVEVALYKHAAELKVLERERWLRTTLRSIGDGVIATDADQGIAFMNPVAEQLTGWSDQEATGKQIGSVLKLFESHSDLPVRCPLEQALSTGYTVSLPAGTAMMRRDGDRLQVDDSAAPILDERGVVVGGVVVFRDVTERRALDARIAIAERLTSVGTLASGVAHEINNPLAFLLANAELAGDVVTALKGRGHANPAELSDLAAMLRDILDGAGRVRDIVKDLGHLAAGESAPRRPLHLGKALQTSLKMVEGQLGPGTNVICEFEPAPLVHASEGRLIQVFSNLLLNSLYAMAARPAHKHQLRLTTRTDHRGFAVAGVRDTGCGIPAQALSHVFDPFFTTKPVGSGMGLGLSISHGIVQQLGGAIAIQSELGQWTSVEVSIPQAPRA